MKKWDKPIDGKKVRPTATPAEVPTDPFSDEAIRAFSRKRLLELASSGGDTAAIRALTELLERSEPKNVPKQERLSSEQLERQNDIFEAHFSGLYCDKCGRGTDA